MIEIPEDDLLQQITGLLSEYSARLIGLHLEICL